MANQSIMVSVHMITYNHENYISWAIEGVLMQKTSFLIELVISDDYSTDNTRFIIEKYAKQNPKIIKPLYRKINLGSLANFQDTFSYCNGKYIALCDGDDYWTDTYKLQKQVSFLEENQDYGLIYSRALILNNSKKKIIRKKLGGILNNKGLLFANPIPTLTTVFRKDLYLKFLLEIKPEVKNWKMGDYPCWLWFYFNSKIYFRPEVTGVYRLLTESASHTLDRKKRYYHNVNSFEIADYYAAKYSDFEHYNEFLEYKNLYLYLYCLKHNISEKKMYINNLKTLNRLSLKTRILKFFFYNLKFEVLFSLLYH